jgi:hypothetical protein
MAAYTILHYVKLCSSIAFHKPMRFLALVGMFKKQSSNGLDCHTKVQFIIFIADACSSVSSSM